MELKAIAILCLTALEIAALLTHNDGMLFSLVVAAVSGLAGYEIGKRQ